MARNIFMKLPPDDVQKYAPECINGPYYIELFAGKSETISPKPQQIMSFSYSHCSHISRTSKINRFNNTLNTDSKDFKQGATAEYPNQFGFEKDEPMLFDPVYLLSDESNLTSCSSPDH